MRGALAGLVTILTFLITALPVNAQTVPAEIVTYTNNTLQIITSIATLIAVLLLIKGGYGYITSSGKPDALDQAKKTIRNTLLGLVIILAANVIVSVFRHALTNPASGTTQSTLNLVPITTVEPSSSLTQVLIDAISGFMQHLVESSTQPIVDAIVSYLTTTPTLLNNSVIFNFWLVSLGIVDGLFVIMVALLGLQFMSATSFGFEEIEFKHLLPRIGLSFLGANMSLFLADYVIITCNSMVQAVLNSTGGLNHAWIVNAVSLTNYLTGITPLITLVFLVIFLIVSIVLLLMYISRLIIISISAVLSPFIFLLWMIPKFADSAEIAVKTYFVTVFTLFIHVVIIQLAASFLALPEQTNNSLASIAVAIGLFLTLLKTPSIMMQFALYTSKNGVVKTVGNKIMNVMSTSQTAPSHKDAALRDRVNQKVVRV